MYRAVEQYFDLIYPHDDFARAFAPAMPDLINRLGRSSDLRVLDLCCGTGRALRPFRDLPGAMLTGADQNRTMLTRARKLFPQGRFIEKDIRQLAPAELGDRNFDVAIIAGVSLLHFSSDERCSIFALAANVLRPGGLLIFDVLHDNQGAKQETFIKSEFEVSDRDIIVVYHRKYESTVAFHTAMVVELPSTGCGDTRFASDCFAFYPLTEAAAQAEATAAGFHQPGVLRTEYRASSFLCFSAA